MSHKIVNTKNCPPLTDVLTEEYLTECINKNWTHKQIAESVGCKETTISKYISKYGLQQRKYKKFADPKALDNILTYEYLKSVHKTKTVAEIMREKNINRPESVRIRLARYNLSEKPYSGKGKLAGEKNPNWKGGKYKSDGYVLVRVDVEYYVPEHILVMEKFIGRKLYRDEVVHHLNGIRDDNRVENLLVMYKRDHDTYHSYTSYNDIDYTKHNIRDILDILYPNCSEQEKMYAELSRIIEAEELKDKKPLG